MINYFNQPVRLKTTLFLLLLRILLTPFKAFQFSEKATHQLIISKYLASPASRNNISSI